MANEPIIDCPLDGVELSRGPTARERLAQGIIVLGGACMAVGGVVGYALGYLEALRQRRDDRETQDR
jgi:hypothetical protein